MPYLCFSTLSLTFNNLYAFWCLKMWTPRKKTNRKKKKTILGKADVDTNIQRQLLCYKP